jgi:hypothetical protein
MKKLWLLFLLVALASLNMPAFADDSMEDMNSAIGALTAKVDDLAKKGPSVEIHGFAQADYINDSTESFAETVGDGKVVLPAAPGTPNSGNNGQSQFSLRNSRISLLAKENVADWMFKGYIETDFLGVNDGSTVNGNEYKFFSQPTLRLRHAYVQGDTTDGWEILAGQYWTLFGWNMDYVLATVAEAPVMGTLYERVPQLKVQKTLGDASGAQVQLAVSAEQPDQTIGQVPNLNAGIRLVMNDMKGYFCGSTGASKLQPMSLGLSMRNAYYVWSDGRDNNVLDQSVWGSSFAGDILVPIVQATEGHDDMSVVLTAEWTAGAGDTLPFNGGGFGGLSTTWSTVTNSGGGYTFGTPAAGSGVNTVLDGGEGTAYAGSNGLQLIQLQSYNAQIQITLPKSIGTIITGGYGEVFASNDNAFATALGSQLYNDDSNWFANVMQDVSKSVRVGLEVAQFSTHYTSATNGVQNPTDNRIQLSTWYRF